ncbi:Hypothetical predicted protein [Pelobates cultripes]|uniref:Transposable element P transposase-like RNase H C-terminal domain-containing protein n=1 Tax=Pelobates cultripes TaxID=61616 RepID=A0AAD1SZ13_PELCU|nr:Hypothetical predicted protein [Pelobates cultripes]
MDAPSSAVCAHLQDHLALLFNSIRASGGWNNNPSACQFQAIFRRLMVQCGVSPGETALKNGGLLIPSQGTVKVLRAAERVIHLASPMQASKVSAVTHIVLEEIGTEDVFLLGEHIEETRRHSLA